MNTSAIGSYQAQSAPPPVQNVQKPAPDPDSSSARAAEMEKAEMAKAYMPNPTETRGNNVNVKA